MAVKKQEPWKLPGKTLQAETRACKGAPSSCVRWEPRARARGKTEGRVQPLCKRPKDADHQPGRYHGSFANHREKATGRRDPLDMGSAAGLSLDLPCCAATCGESWADCWRQEIRTQGPEPRVSAWLGEAGRCEVRMAMGRGLPGGARGGN